MGNLNNENSKKLYTIPSRKRRIAKKLTRVLGDFTVTGKEFNYKCPFCVKSGKDVRGHIHVNYEKGKALCHKCGYGAGALIKVFYDLNIEDADLFRASTKNLKTFWDELFQPKNRITKLQSIKLPESYKILRINATDIASKIFMGYMTRFRGVTTNELSTIPVGYSLEGRYAGRIIFPVYMHGKLVYFTARAVLSGEPKNLHPDVERRSIVYGLDWLVSTDHIFVVEGVLDTFAFPNCSIAIFSHHLTPEQGVILRSLNCKEITICFDSDVEKRLIIKACQFLTQQTESTISFMELESGDPFDNRHTISRYIDRRIVYNTGQALRNKLVGALENGIKKKEKVRRKISLPRMFN